MNSNTKRVREYAILGRAFEAEGTAFLKGPEWT